MANSIINATTNGLSATGGNTAVLELQAGGVTALSVNSSGFVFITPLSVDSGGTGANTLTANNVILGNGTSAVQFVAPGTSSNVLTSNGTTWVSQEVGGGFASGTVMLFGQTSAPTGWTKDTTNYNNSGLRVVTGTASTGGSVDFTTAFASQSVAGTVGSYTLTTSDIPSHNHTYYRSNGTGQFTGSCGGGYSNENLVSTGSTGSGGGHSHSFSGTAINLAVKYVDVIRATKD